MSRDSSPEPQSRPRQDLYGYADGPQTRPDAGDRRQCIPAGSPADQHMLREASLSNPSSRDWFRQNQETRTQPVQLDQNGMYTVTHGDCLSTIAERMLKQQGMKADGRSIQATVDNIVKLNQDQFPSLAQDPGKIGDGWKLRLMAGGPDQAQQPADMPPTGTRPQQRPGRQDRNDLYGFGEPDQPQAQPRPQQRPGRQSANDLYGFGEPDQPQAQQRPGAYQQQFQPGPRPMHRPQAPQQYSEAAPPMQRPAAQPDYPQYGVPDAMPGYAPPRGPGRPRPEQYAPVDPRYQQTPESPQPYYQPRPGYPPGYPQQGYAPQPAPYGTDLYGRPYQQGDIPVVSDLLRLPGEIASGIVRGISRGAQDWNNFFQGQSSSNNCYPATMAMMYNDWSGSRARDLGPFNRAAGVSPGSDTGYRGSEADMARQIQATMPGMHTEPLRGHTRQELAAELDRHVKQGHTLIVGIQSPYHAGNNHYIYVAGQDPNTGRYIIGDPGNHNGGRLGKSISREDLINRMVNRHGGPRAVAGWSDTPPAAKPGTAAYNMAMARQQANQHHYAENQPRQPGYTG